MPHSILSTEKQVVGSLPSNSVETLTFMAPDGHPVRVAVIKHQEQPSTAADQKVLVFIAGLGGSSLLALDYLEPMLPAFDTVIGIDLRGFGINNQILANHPNKQLQDIMVGLPQIMEQLAIRSPRYFLSGISLGACMCVHLACHPLWRQPWEALMLLAPGFVGHEKSFPLSYITVNVFKWLSGQQHCLTLPYGIEALTRNPRYLEKESCDGEYQALGLHQPHPMRMPMPYMLRTANFNQNALNECKNISTPTLIFIPEDDIVCDTTAMRKGFERIPKRVAKQCMTVPLAKHDLLLEPEAESLGLTSIAWLRENQLI